MTGRLVVRRSIAVAVTSLAVFGLARLSAWPVPQHRGNTSRLRLSWTARPERIEVCRALSAEALAQREEHMRQRVECDGRFATYALRVTGDGRVLHESVVRGAGLRHDRPMYLLQEIDLLPGAHALRISFTRREKTDGDAAAFVRLAPAGVDTGLFGGRAEREAAEHARRARAAIPPRLELDTTIVFEAERVLVVSFDAERRAFRLLSATP